MSHRNLPNLTLDIIGGITSFGLADFALIYCGRGFIYCGGGWYCGGMVYCGQGTVYCGEGWHCGQ